MSIIGFIVGLIVAIVFYALNVQMLQATLAEADVKLPKSPNGI